MRPWKKKQVWPASSQTCYRLTTTEWLGLLPVAEQQSSQPAPCTQTNPAKLDYKAAKLRDHGAPGGRCPAPRFSARVNEVPDSHGKLGRPNGCCRKQPAIPSRRGNDPPDDRKAEEQQSPEDQILAGLLHGGPNRRPLERREAAIEPAAAPYQQLLNEQERQHEFGRDPDQVQPPRIDVIVQFQRRSRGGCNGRCRQRAGRQQRE